MSLKGSSLTFAEEIAVPGSVANLGPGFDTLGVAVQLYLRARILGIQDTGARLVVSRSVPSVPGENAVSRAFALAAERTGRRAPTVVVEVESEIPMASGLGSSAAATVAGLRLFERATGPLPPEVLLELACELEGHADNAAPAIYGGLTSVVDTGVEPRVLHWTWPDGLQLVVATPAAGLSTATARAALPAAVPRTDAIFNLQRAIALLHALQADDDELLRTAVQDRLHQPARAALVPCLADVLALQDPDVLGAFLSGAGPSVAVLARRSHARIERLLAGVYERAGIAVTVRTLRVHQPSNMMAGAVASAPGRSL